MDKKDIKEKEIAFFKKYFEDENITYLEGRYQWYKKMKRWGKLFLNTYDTNQFQKAKNELTDEFKTFTYIFSRLEEDEKIEFKFDYLDKLKKLSEFQNFQKFQELIKQQIEQVKKHRMENEAESNKDEPEKVENPYPNIFKGTGYELWKRMFDGFKITESKRTDVRFMFEVLQKDGYIYKNIGESVLREWINETYEFSMDKLPFTDPKNLSNHKRLALYQSIKSNL